MNKENNITKKEANIKVDNENDKEKEEEKLREE